MTDDAKPNDASPTGVPRELVMRLAIAHRRALLAMLLVILTVLSLGLLAIGFVDRPPVIETASTFAALGVCLFTAHSVLKLAALIGSEQGIGILYVLLLLFLPPIGLSLVFLLCRRAEKILKKNGVDVGLMGADLSTV